MDGKIQNILLSTLENCLLQHSKINKTVKKCNFIYGKCIYSFFKNNEKTTKHKKPLSYRKRRKNMNVMYFFLHCIL